MIYNLNQYMLNEGMISEDIANKISAKIANMKD